jgi:hypothetical protein
MAGPDCRKRAFMHGRVQTIVAVAAVGAALLASGSAAASIGAIAASRSHVWGTAIQVPGTAALRQSGFADSGERHTNQRDRV